MDYHDGGEQVPQVICSQILLGTFHTVPLAFALADIQLRPTFVHFVEDGFVLIGVIVKCRAILIRVPRIIVLQMQLPCIRYAKVFVPVRPCTLVGVGVVCVILIVVGGLHLDFDVVEGGVYLVIHGELPHTVDHSTHIAGGGQAVVCLACVHIHACVIHNHMDAPE